MWKGRILNDGRNREKKLQWIKICFQKKLIREGETQTITEETINEENILLFMSCELVGVGAMDVVNLFEVKAQNF